MNAHPIASALASSPHALQRTLGDTAARDYSRKLQLFAALAEPELRAAITILGLKPGMRVLDAGCGTGEALGWLSEEVGPQGEAVGFDLATAHVVAAAAHMSARTTRVAGNAAHTRTNGRPNGPPQRAFVLQADLLRVPFRPGSFDAIWCANTINHARDPVAAVISLTALLRSGGRLAVAQSSLLPEMYFAWDSRLERMTNEAVRQYYRDRYRLSERDLTGIRSLVGWVRAAQLDDVTARTFLIERISPLRPADEAYLAEAIFRDTWGERLRPYLSASDYAELVELCNPDSARYALRRPDFHFLQSLTVVTGAT
jgi:SAM-dependent methyltransferase